MSATPLVEQLRRDADAEVARRLETARAASERVEREGATRLAAERDDALRAAAGEAAIRLAHERAERDRKRQFDLLSARRRLVDRVIEVAMRRAPAIAGERDVAVALRRSLHEALAYLPEGDRTVRCHPAVIPALQAAIADAGATLVADSGLSFGFLAQSGDGRVCVDATLEGMAQRERAALSIALVRHAGEGGA